MFDFSGFKWRVVDVTCAQYLKRRHDDVIGKMHRPLGRLYLDALFRAIDNTGRERGLICWPDIGSKQDVLDRSYGYKQLHGRR